MEDGRLVKMAVQQMYDNRKEGDLLMDAPETKTWQELCRKAADNEKEWKEAVKKIKDTVHIKAAKTGKRKDENKTKKRKKTARAGGNDSDADEVA